MKKKFEHRKTHTWRTACEYWDSAVRNKELLDARREA